MAVQAESMTDMTGATLAGQSAEGRPAESSDHLRTVALRAYSEQKSRPPEDNQIMQLLPMVCKLAHRAAAYLKPPLLSEDLVSAGVVGLLKAARDFDPSRHAEFTTYAYIRIKGAILDELRNASLLPASLNKQIRTALELSRKITEQTGAAPTDEELADKLGISLDDLYHLFEGARARQFVSLDSSEHESAKGGPLADILPSPNANAPDLRLEQAELVEHLAAAIQQLDPKRRQIIILYYYQHLTMKQIAEVLEVTESRVSQLHASALFNLSLELKEWENGRQ